MDRMSKFAYPRMRIRMRMPVQEAPRMRLHMIIPVSRYPWIRRRMRIFVTFNGIGWWKKNHLLFIWEKNVLHTKNYKHEFPSKVCFETFSEKRKENELHRKYTLFRGFCRKAIFSYNFTDITKFMILFHLQWPGAERHIPVLLISEK